MSASRALKALWMLCSARACSIVDCIAHLVWCERVFIDREAPEDQGGQQPGTVAIWVRKDDVEPV